MRAIVVGSGAGGATIARELSRNGMEVIILEAGGDFKPFTRRLSWSEPLRKIGLMGNEKTITRLFPYLETTRSSKELVLVRGRGTGGSTVLSCGNMVRADQGIKEIGLDLESEFKELEDLIGVKEFPYQRWRPLTQKMFKSAEKMGLNPHATPKAMDTAKCVSCGLCELGCASDSRWDSRRFLEDALKHGAILKTKSPVKKLLLEKGKVKGVEIRSGISSQKLKADLVVLSAGGIGTAQILKASGLPAKDNLWVDIVITLGGIFSGAKMIKEPPMAWYSQQKDYIISPYVDILSHWFHKPWKNVSLNDRVGMMVKLADLEEGSVFEDGKVQKEISYDDKQKMNAAIAQVQKIMENSGVSGPYVQGMYNGGHLGGTVPLKKSDVGEMIPNYLPEGLWVGDLSLAPRSQGMPTILLAAALGLKVARKILENNAP
ncbi:MAG: GMC family oxidoreductase N-terminal domain-containing protein [Methanobacteriaceae archaeon]|nr:GMC family oxidoreductase N-terminal domain-containing protein [Methanobacteriaceae archaeon]MDP2836941.1 GMC family oxidoreductase N-terminal domain-containing protein [Methanobacteriaceae archaeon]MDP3485518.1 GMC family oxidoreductase N-terminal domain-containing protein [Methanobacteriaceae archaeon]